MAYFCMISFYGLSSNVCNKSSFVVGNSLVVVSTLYMEKYEVGLGPNRFTVAQNISGLDDLVVSTSTICNISHCCTDAILMHCFFFIVFSFYLQIGIYPF